MDITTGTPLVTVIIPTYNRENIVRKAMESVLGQTYKNIQFIVVDDGSTDSTEAVVKAYPGVQYVWQENGGSARARNTGLGLARGTYIATLDSDDIWEPDFLTCCIKKLEDDQLDFVFANWLQLVSPRQGIDFLSNFKFLRSYIDADSSPWKSLGNNDLRYIYTHNCPSPSSSLVIRRTSVKNGWNEDIHIGDDWCMLIDMILSPSCRAAFTMERLWIKRTDGQNIYDGRDSLEILELLRVTDLNLIIEKYRDRLSDGELKLLSHELARNTYQLIIRKFLRRIDFSADLVMFRKATSKHRFMAFKIGLNFFLKMIRNKLAPEATAPAYEPISWAVENHESISAS